MVDDIDNIVDVVWYERPRSSDRQLAEEDSMRRRDIKSPEDFGV